MTTIFLLVSATGRRRPRPLRLLLLPSRRSFLLLLRLFEVNQLFLVRLEFCLQLGRPVEQLRRHAMDLALHVELVALDLQYRVLSFTCLG